MIVTDLLVLSQFVLLSVLFTQIKINYIVRKRLDNLESLLSLALDIESE